MRLLLDTHALLWWLADDSRLGEPARRLIADPAHDVLVSVASFWEIVVKIRIGRLEADAAAIATAVEGGGCRRLAITDAHLSALLTLPAHHRDPFDHLLIAQAIVEGAVFVSDDRHAPLYPIQLVTCSAGPPGHQSPG